MVSNSAQKRIVSSVLITTIAAQLYAGGAWTLLIGHAVAQSGETVTSSEASSSAASDELQPLDFDTWSDYQDYKASQEQSTLGEPASMRMGTTNDGDDDEGDDDSDEDDSDEDEDEADDDDGDDDDGDDDDSDDDDEHDDDDGDDDDECDNDEDDDTGCDGSVSSHSYSSHSSSSSSLSSNSSSSLSSSSNSNSSSSSISTSLSSSASSVSSISSVSSSSRSPSSSSSSIPGDDDNIPAGPQFLTCTNQTIVFGSDTWTTANGSPSVETWEHPDWIDGLPPGDWMWDSYYEQTPLAGRTITFERQFTINGNPGTASIDLTADDGYKIYVNNVFVGDHGNTPGVFTMVRSHNLTPFLQSGINTLRIVVKNAPKDAGDQFSNPGGLIYRASVSCNTPVQNPDLSIIKSGPASVVRGQMLSYTITVGNSGNAVATNIVITDPIPAGLTYNDAQSHSSCNQQGNNVVCTQQDINPGQFGSFTIAFDVPAVQSCSPGSVTNSISIASTQTDANTSNNTSTVTTPITCPSPLLGCIDVLKEGFDAFDNELETLPSFTFTLDGNASIQTNAQGNARFNNVSVGAHTVTETSLAGWTLFNVTPQNGVVNVSAGSTCSAIVFKNRRNPLNADLAIQKTGPSQVLRGTNFTYALVIANNGPGTAQNVVVTDTIPSGLTFVSADNCSFQSGVVSCNAGTILPQTTRTFFITVTTQAQSQCSPTTISNTGFVSSTTNDHVPGNNQSTITTQITCPVIQTGCIEIRKESLSPSGRTLSVTPQFTFTLDATRVAYNDSTGYARFDNVTAGQHSIAEIIPSGWVQLSATPSQGTVQVAGGNSCAQVTFRNQQVLVANAQCQDNIDNDGDGLKDYPQDPGCQSSYDNDEYNVTILAACQDGVDNDGDSLIDYPQDPGCASVTDTNEYHQIVSYACSDGYDNDGDGTTDYPQDPGCSSQNDTDEYNHVAYSYACSDGYDNDGDNLTDYPQDPGCLSAQDTNEFNFRPAQCNDGLDNDNDGNVDYPQDTGCSGAQDDNEYSSTYTYDMDRWRRWWNWNW